MKKYSVLILIVLLLVVSTVSAQTSRYNENICNENDGTISLRGDVAFCDSLNPPVLENTCPDGTNPKYRYIYEDESFSWTCPLAADVSLETYKTCFAGFAISSSDCLNYPNCLNAETAPAVLSLCEIK